MEVNHSARTADFAQSPSSSPPYGSARFGTIVDLAKRYGIDLPSVRVDGVDRERNRDW
jgi:hypothetical protein